MKQNDVVNHPEHYTNGQYECFDVMRDVFGDGAIESFCLCNAFKYLWRHKYKNGVEDLEKAEWYLKKLIELEGEKNDR